MKIYDIRINDEDETGVQLVSFVKSPAMEVEAIKLSKEPMLFAKDEYKQYLTSAVIIPDKLIPRMNGNEMYMIRFSSDTIEKIRNKFHTQTGNLKLSNFDHNSEYTVSATLIESWIKTSENDKSVALGFDLPVGSWLSTYHVSDTQFWNEKILTNEVTGFSLEGVFETIETKLPKDEEPTLDQLMDDLLADILK
ncbi:XkdF-like putative serine protease domain-containing protein [Xanthocytophaga agilis]|uniref:XkdF-like putative serine protease domain-containing protein n=1 Tax=Xanthocytophaga agilis TaxID=3048010 RepID=A0AAE3UCZ9_9BACT|nr:XkdF-like putative serine protease domain-containing protein [Xanthocytophaga agilis]MDJ1500670.1 XkdF-like putative serine protease domain-containing protein [Xanthocytophaga agilis]